MGEVNRRRLAWGLAVVAAAAVFALLGRVVFNVQILRWQTHRILNRNEQVLAAIAVEVRGKNIVRVDLDAGSTPVFECEPTVSECGSSRADMYSDLARLGFKRVLRTGSSVYFVWQAGFGYDMGLVNFLNPPASLRSQGLKPFFEYQPISGSWYFYRRN